MVNRVISFVPKYGHSASQTELKIILKRHRNFDSKNREKSLKTLHALSLLVCMNTKISVFFASVMTFKSLKNVSLKIYNL